MKLAHIVDGVVTNVSIPPVASNVWPLPKGEDIVLIGDDIAAGIGDSFDKDKGAFIRPEPVPEPE